MANTITDQVLFDGNNRLVKQLDIKGDATAVDETNTVVVDLSSLVGPDGKNPPEMLRVDVLYWELPNGATAKLEFDRDISILIANMASEDGVLKFHDVPGVKDTGTGGTGDVLLTTEGQISGGVFRIYLDIKKHGPRTQP